MAETRRSLTIMFNEVRDEVTEAAAAFIEPCRLKVGSSIVRASHTRYGPAVLS